MCPVYGRDIIFVIDGSGSVGLDNFQQVKEWVIELASNFDISDGTNQIGVVQYSHFFRNQ